MKHKHCRSRQGIEGAPTRRMTAADLPDWWAYPRHCQHGHRAPGCDSAWYEPPHDPAAALARPVAPGSVRHVWRLGRRSPGRPAGYPGRPDHAGRTGRVTSGVGNPGLTGDAAWQRGCGRLITGLREVRLAAGALGRRAASPRGGRDHRSQRQCQQGYQEDDEPQACGTGLCRAQGCHRSPFGGRRLIDARELGAVHTAPGVARVLPGILACMIARRARPCCRVLLEIPGVGAGGNGGLRPRAPSGVSRRRRARR